MKIKKVMTRQGRLIRLFRIMWTKGKVGDGKGYSAMFSVSLFPCLFWFRKGLDEYYFWIFGIRFHYQKRFGGIHT